MEDKEFYITAVQEVMAKIVLHSTVIVRTNKVAGIMSETVDSKQVSAICRKTRRPSAVFTTVKSIKGFEHACQNGLARRDAQLFLVPEVKQVSDGLCDESQVKLLVCNTQILGTDTQSFK